MMKPLWPGRPLCTMSKPMKTASIATVEMDTAPLAEKLKAQADAVANLVLKGEKPVTGESATVQKAGVGDQGMLLWMPLKPKDVVMETPGTRRKLSLRRCRGSCRKPRRTCWLWSAAPQGRGWPRSVLGLAHCNNPRGSPCYRDYHAKKQCAGNCGRSHSRPVMKDGWICDAPPVSALRKLPAQVMRSFRRDRASLILPSGLLSPWVDQGWGH